MASILRTFILLGLTLSFGAYAQVKHIVIDMDEVIVRQVPKSLRSNYAASSLVEARDDYTKLYHKMPHVAEAFMRLQNENSVLVHFLTNKSRQWAIDILQSFTLRKPYEENILLHFGAGSANRIISSDDLQNGIFDPASLTTDVKNVLVVTNNLGYFGGKDSANRIALPNVLYYYNTHQEAQNAINSFKADGSFDTHKDHLPADEEIWKAEHFKMALLMAKLIDEDIFTATEAVRLVPRINGYANLSAVNLGLKIADNAFNSQITRWRYNKSKSKITGCERFDLAKNTLVKVLSVSDCRQKLGTEIAFNLDKQSFKVLACEEMDLQHGASIGRKPIADCEKNAEYDFYWKLDHGQKSCAAFVHSLFYLRKAQSHQCDIMLYELINGKPEIGIDLAVIGLKGVAKGISDIKPNAPLPLASFDDYPINVLATSLVLRKHQKDEKFLTSGFHYDFFNDTKVIMAFDQKWIGAILDKGFLNQHQIGHTNGYYGPARRANLEDILIGVKIESHYGSAGSKANLLRPKYSFMIPTKPSKAMGYTQVRSHYGNVFAVYKKKTKARSTFTLGDSLDMSAGYSDVRTFFYRSKEPLRILSNDYSEAQIWGSAQVIEDVDHFLVNCSHVSQTTQENIDLLKSTGKPVYQCQTKSDSGYPYLLYKGDQV